MDTKTAIIKEYTERQLPLITCLRHGDTFKSYKMECTNCIEARLAYDNFKKDLEWLDQALTRMEQNILQDVVDNLGYLKDTPGDLRLDAKSLHEHYLKRLVDAEEKEEG